MSSMNILVIGGNSFTNRKLAQGLISKVISDSACSTVTITEPGVSKNYCCLESFCKNNNYNYERLPYDKGSYGVRSVTKKAIDTLALKDAKAIVIFWRGESWSITEYLRKINKLQIPTYLYNYTDDSIEVLHRKEL